MKQHEFVWKVHSNTDVKTTQTVNGITECFIRENLILSHNYKKNDQVLLTFKDMNKIYLISSDSEFKEIFKIINSNENIIQPLIDYCEKNLKSINK